MARKNLLKGFKKPKGISFEHISTNPNYGKFTAYPFETGFGTTVGNTLRRVLLSSIQGYAITSIRITSYDENGISRVISSEFEAIPNVAEDTLEIINSLKQIRLALPNELEQDTINFEFKGPGVVKSDDFAKDGQLEVMTKDQLIFTMMEGAHLDVEIQVDLGRGYVPAEVNEHYIEIVGTIPMDAIFTPVPKVKYSIEPCRVGQRNDYDKLVLEIWTDGTIAPEDALAGIAALDGAVEVVPMVEDADVIRWLLYEGGIGRGLAERLHAEQVVGAIEQAGFGAGLDLSLATGEGDAE